MNSTEKLYNQLVELRNFCKNPIMAEQLDKQIIDLIERRPPSKINVFLNKNMKHRASVIMEGESMFSDRSLIMGTISHFETIVYQYEISKSIGLYQFINTYEKDYRYCYIDELVRKSKSRIRDINCKIIKD